MEILVQQRERTKMVPAGWSKAEEVGYKNGTCQKEEKKSWRRHPLVSARQKEIVNNGAHRLEHTDDSHWEGKKKKR